MFIMILLAVFACDAAKKGKGMVTDRLIDALVKVESGGDSTKVGKLGELGILQIRQCVIDDVNRIYKTKYVLADAKNDAKAKDICRKYLTHWGSHYQRKTGKVATNEVLSKIWNGGPNGWRKKTTYVITNLDKYWKKVQQELVIA